MLKLPHLAIGGNVASCPVKKSELSDYLQVNWGQLRSSQVNRVSPFAWCVNMCKIMVSPIEAINMWGV